MSKTHRDIAPAANRGESCDAGNLYTFPGESTYYRSFFSASWMARGMADALEVLSAYGLKANQTIGSFNTPIAMRFNGPDDHVWIMAETNYSARTSQQINKLMGGWANAGLSGRIERVPADVTADELRRIIDGKMRYVLPRTRHGVGSYVPGINYTEGE